MVDSVTPPEFIRKPENITVNEGETIKIQCKISGIPTPEVLWFKSGEPVKADKKHLISSDDQIYKLEVIDAGKDDSGEYAVAAINPEGKIYFNLNVDVKKESKSKKNKDEAEKKDEKSDLKQPEFTFKPTSMTATEFDPVQIFCKVSGQPVPVVTWYKEGKPLRSGGNISMFNEDDSHYLVILKSSLLDAGEYTCTANNDAGAVFCTLKLTIEGLTEVESSTSTDIDSSMMDKLTPKIAAELENIADESTDEELLREFVMNTKYTDKAKGICLDEGEIVELLDKSVPTAWLVRVQRDKETICSVPPNLLTPKDEVIQKVKATAEELSPPGKEELQAPLSPGQNEMKRRGKLSRSPSKKQSSTEQDSSEDEDKLGKIEAYPVYVVVADFVPDETQFDFLPLSEGQFVHVCDSKNVEHWLSKTKPSKINPSKEGWISPSFVEKKEGLGFVDKRTSKEVFREEVIQCTNKKQESLIKRRYALTELLETERDYIKELASILEEFSPIFEDKNLPESLQGRKDLILANLADIFKFHNDIFLSELMNCTSDPGTIGDIFLTWENKFEEYIDFLKRRPEADLLLTLSSNTSYLKDYKRKNNLEKSLFEYLDAPYKHLKKSESLLKDFLKYSSRAKADNKALIQAIAMLARIVKTSEDKVHLDNIEGYPGDINSLGPVVRHDDFSQWDAADKSGRGKDRHCFLFNDKLLITKPKRVDDPMNLPTYIFKGVVDLTNVQINELVLDEDKFELWYAQPDCEKITFQARDVYAKKAWVHDIREKLKEMGIEETDLPLDKVPDVGKTKTNKSSPPLLKRKSSQDASSNRKLQTDQDENQPRGTGEFTTDTESKQYITAEDESETYDTAPEVEDGYAKPIILKKIIASQVKEGEVAVFECTVLGQPTPTITWLKDDSPVVESPRFTKENTTTDEYRLKIEETREDDTGVYTIQASNDLGRTECSANLTVKKDEKKAKDHAPKITEEPTKSCETLAGSEVKVTAKISSNPKPDVKWLKDGKELKANDPHYTFVNEGDEYSLIISSADLKDSATYALQAKNKLGKVEAKTQVQIKEKEKAPKVVKELSKKQEAEAGSEVKVTAKISSNPKPDVKWLQDGKELKANDPHYTFVNEGDEYSLIISSADVKDSATYTLQAENKLGKVETKTQVEIREKEKAPIVVVEPPKNQKGEAGSEVKVTAKISSNPKPDVKWLKDGKELKANDPHCKSVNKGDEYSLIISSAEVKDSATYTLQAKNKLGKVEAKTQVQIKEKEKAPTLVKEPSKKQETQAGSEVKVTAKISSNPKPDVKWLKDGKELKANDPHYTFVNEGEEFSLIISSADVKDSATYTLQAKNNLGKVEAKTQVQIKEKEQAPRVVKELSKKQEAEAGSDVKVTAKISSNPKPDVKWLKDGKELKVNDSHYKVVNEGDEYSLTISSAEVKDSATYTVQAKNKLGKVEAKTQVQIKEKEQAPIAIEELSKKQEAKVGSEVKVTAKISSNPKPDVKWLKDGKELKANDTHYTFINEGEECSLIISSADVKDSATYTLQAENKLGKVETKTQVEIRENEKAPKVVEEPPKNQKGEAGSEVKVTAKISSNPKPDVKWLKDGKELMATDHYKFVNEGDEYSLIISSAEEKDSATYTLQAKNKLGNIDIKTQVEIKDKAAKDKSTKQEPPKFKTKLENIISIEGEPLSLEVKVTANPEPAITWFVDGHKLKPSDDISMSYDGETAIFMINEAFPEDTGLYTCRALNAFGEVETDAEVIVEERPRAGATTAPKLWIPLEDLKIKEKKVACFECSVTSSTPPEIVWLHNDKPVEPSDRIEMYEDGDFIGINILCTSEKDSGKYTCIVRNKQGEVSSSAELIVESVKKEIVGYAPLMTWRLKDQEAVTKETVRFDCRCTSDPEPEIKWFKDGEELKVDEKYAVEQKEGNFALIIHDLISEDEGVYKCTVTNALGTVSSSATLIIDEAPINNSKSPEPETTILPRRESVSPESRKVLKAQAKEKEKQKQKAKLKKEKSSELKSVDPTMTSKGKQDQKPETEEAYEEDLDEADTGVPLAPRAINDAPIVHDMAEDSLTLSWPESVMPSYAKQVPILYDVEVRELPGKDWKPIVRNLDDTVYHITGMKPDREYMYRVRAVNDLGISDPSLSTTVHKRAGPPELPSAKPTFKVLAPEEIELSWKKATVAKGHLDTDIAYNVEIREPPSKEWKILASNISDNRLKTYMHPGRDYQVKVTALNQWGMSEPTMAVMVPRRDDKFMPEMPRTKPHYEMKDASTLVLNWEAARLPPGGPPGVKVSYIIEGSEFPSYDFKTIATDLLDTEYTLNDLKQDKDYMFRVLATTKYAISDPSPSVSVHRTAVARKQPENIVVKPKVEELDGDSIRLSWPASKPPGGAKAPVWYTVEESEPNTNEWRKLAEKLDVTTYVVKELTNDRDYSFRIRAENDYGTSDPSPSVNVFRTGAPRILPVAVQEKPSVSAVNPTTLKLSWWAPYCRTVEAEPQSYAIEINNSGSKNGPWDVIASGINDTKFTLNELDPKVEYMFRIVSENDTGVSKPSPETKFKQNLDTFLPGAVREKPKVTDVDPTTVKLLWMAPYTSSRAPPPTSYRLEISDSPDSGWDALVDHIRETSFTLDDLLPDTPYYLRIVSQNEYGSSDPSPAAKVYKKSSSFLPEGILEKPRITEISPTSARVVWLPPRMSPSAPTYTYAVECREGRKGEWRRIEGGLEEHVTSFTAVDLRPESDYAFRIIVENSYGSGEPSPLAIRSASLDLVPSGIKGKLSMKDVGPGSVQLHWDKPRVPPIGRYTYLIEYRDPHTNEWKKLIGDLSDQTYVIDNLRPELDYMYRIVVQNEYGNSNPSATVTRFGERDALLPLMPKDKPMIMELGPSAVELSWKEAKSKTSTDEAITYILEMKEGSSGQWKEYKTDLTETHLRIANLGYDKDYMFRVRAKNEHGVSDPTHSITAHRSKSAFFPNQIHDKPQLSVLSRDSAVLSWSVPSQPSHLRDLPFMYVIEAREHPSRDWKEIAQDIEDPTFDLNKLSRDKEYSFRVLVENEYGLSEPSPSVTLSRKEADYVPRTPTDKPRLSDVKAETLRLSWDEVEPPPMATDSPVTYIIETRDSKYNWTTYVDDIKTTSHEVKAAPDIEHAFRIRAKNIFGRSDPSRQVTVPKRQVFPDPISDKPFLMELTPDTVKLSWRSPRAAFMSELPSSAYSYILEYRQPPSDKWKKLIGGLKETSFTIRDLEKDKEYMFRVRTQNDFGTSEPSAPVLRAKLPDHAAIRRSRSRSREPSPWRLPSDVSTDVAPEFTNVEQNVVYGVQGQPVKLNASLKAYPEPKIMWFHNEDKIDLGGRCNSYKSANGQYSLEIEKMTSSDVGAYRIYAENSQGIAEHTFKLELADPPIFLEPMKNTDLRVWTYGKLDCRIDGLPYPEVKFFKDWHPLTQTARVKANRTDYDYWSLNFDNTILLDEGMYICVAENIAGKAYCVANLVIEEKPPLIDVKFKPTHISDFYYVLDEIERGSHGVIRRVVEKSTGVEFAAKFLRARDENQKNELKQEGDVMSLLSHRHVVRLTDAYEMKKNIVLVMELLTGEELLDCIIDKDRLTESEVAYYIRQVLEALQHLHSKGVVHLDVKPENLRLSTPGADDNIKLIDFGFSRRIYKNKETFVDLGTPEFVSPEILRQEPVTHVADTWSVGVLTYILLSGISPFLASSDRETLLRIKDGQWSFDETAFENITDEAKDFIDKLLVSKPKSRMTVKQCFEHPWLQVSKQRGQGIKINTERHKVFSSRRKFECSQHQVNTIVFHRKMSLLMVELPKLQIPSIEVFDEPEDRRPQLINNVNASFNGLMPGSPTGIILSPGTSRASSVEPSEFGDSESTDPGFDDECLMEDWIHQYGPIPHKQKHKLDDLKFDDFFGKQLGVEKPINPPTSPGKKRMRKISFNNEPPPIGDTVEAPVFKETIKDKAYDVGENVTLHCQVIGKPAPTVYWYRNDEPLWDGERIRIQHSKDTGHTSLTILNTLPHDYGIYKCVASCAGTRAVTKGRLFLGDVPGRPGRPVVQQVSSSQALIIWEEPDHDGNGHILNYRVDYRINVGQDKWSIATYTIDECALVSGLRPNTVYRFRVCGRNRFGVSPYSWASIEVRTKSKGSSKLKMDRETKRIILRSQRAKLDDSDGDDEDDVTPTASRRGSTDSIENNVPATDVALQETDPKKHYDIEGQIEGGHFNVVVNCRSKTKNKEYIAKILGYNVDTKDSILREYHILKALNHHRVVQLFEAYITDKQLVLIFEKLQGEEVTRAISFKTRYNEETVCRIIRQVVAALQYLHSYGIVHLNIQPGNIMLCSRRRLDLKIIDFTCARAITDEEGETFGKLGMPEFMAPEMISNRLVGCAADIWNVGILTYIMLSGESPLLGTDDESTFDNITRLRYDADQLYGHITKAALKFMYNILKVNPSERLSLDDCVESRWLSLSENMVKRRRANKFITSKLRHFQEVYTARRRALGKPSEELLGSYAHIKRASSVDSDTETDFTL
ncbi:protein Obscurin-like [Tubulanus polymorphus]|uniref:protein Obscurin-like n=1 Tax=Tubulanus polymorphus TaxID=672921 RepID=UPI003DA402B4